jgi:hypothetical protein
MRAPTGRGRRLLVTAVCLSTGCGTQTPTAPSSAPPALATGAYTLTFLPDTTANVPDPCPELTLADTSAAIPVQVSGRSPSWLIQPEPAADQGFRATLDASGLGVSGRMSGAARDPVSGVVVTVSDLPPLTGTSGPGIPAIVLGIIDTPGAASGSVGGQVRLTLGTAARRCLGTRWRLEAR